MEFSPEITELMSRLFCGKSRYRVAYGGRCSGKSYGFADMALERMVARHTDIAICREIQTTISDSVHKLLKNRIKYHKITHLFSITINSIIYNPNGSKIVYKYLHDNETEVKGLEGNHVCWIFEAHNLSAESWKYLNPTIRRTPDMPCDPEFWIEFNPEYADDFVYKNFIESNLKNCTTQYITYLDNPFCPADQAELAEQEKKNDIDEYNHIWLGLPKKTGGLVYPGFDRNVHVRDLDLKRIEHVGNFFMGQDPHTVYYPFCVWIGREPRGDDAYNYYVYNEYPTSGTFNNRYYYELRKEKKCALTLKQRANIYKILDNTIVDTVHGIQITARGIDTRFAKGAGTGSTTSNTRGIIVEMADPAHGGLRFETPPEHMIDSQRENIRQLLYYDKSLPITAFNEPRLYISSHCVNMIDTMRFHRFDKSGKEREDEKRKDASDALKIGLAIAQQYKHKSKKDTIKKTVLYKQPCDPVQQLRDQYMGKYSVVQLK